MKKILIVLVIATMFLAGRVYAFEYTEDQVTNLVIDYLKGIERGEVEPELYIDTHNAELLDNTKNFNGKAYINLYNYKVEEYDDYAVINGYINARGTSGTSSWQVSGFKAEFVVREIDGRLAIESTSVFNYLGTENVVKIVGKVFAIVGLAFGGVVFLVLICLLISKMMKKRKSELYTGV